MRHLWGKKARYDEGKNPFFGLSLGDRLDIITAAYELALKLKTDYKGKYIAFDMDVAGSQAGSHPFYTAERQVKDREILYAHFNKKKVIKFYNLLSHSTMGLVASATMDFSNFCQAANHDGVINYDDSDASKGFDTSDLFSALAEHGWAKRVRYDTHDSETNEALLQLADLITFKTYRQALAAYRGDPEQKNDPFREVSKSLDAVFAGQQPVRNTEVVPYEGETVHYQVARMFLHKINPGWVNRHMKTFVELQAEMVNSVDGVPLIREASYEEYLRTGTLT